MEENKNQESSIETNVLNETNIHESIDIEIIPKWKQRLILFIKDKIEKGVKLTFIHTPKCAGTYAAKYLEYFKINNKQHNRANKRDGFTFTIIRDPIDRYESLLNYRLSRNKLGKDWPRRLKGVLHNPQITLDQIVESMTRREIKNFTPFYTLRYWTKGVHLILTIQEFLPFLKMLGYKIDKIFERENVSQKLRGKIGDKNKEKLKKIYLKDFDIYSFWTRKDSIEDSNKNLDSNLNKDSENKNNDSLATIENN